LAITTKDAALWARRFDKSIVVSTVKSMVAFLVAREVGEWPVH